MDDTYEAYEVYDDVENPSPSGGIPWTGLNETDLPPPPDISEIHAAHEPDMYETPMPNVSNRFQMPLPSVPNDFQTTNIGVSQSRRSGMDREARYRGVKTRQPPVQNEQKHERDGRGIERSTHSGKKARNATFVLVMLSIFLSVTSLILIPVMIIRKNEEIRSMQSQISEMKDSIESIQLNYSTMTVAASSCKELNETHGKMSNGYYLLRQKYLLHPAFVYCDFNIHEDPANCSELRKKRQLVIETGRFFIRQRSAEIQEIACTAGINGQLPYSTCHEIRERGIAESGFYTLNSPSRGPYQVYCNFTERKAITQVSHQSMHEIKNPASSSQRCDSAGCYLWEPKYILNSYQIHEIVRKSAECRQYIKV